MTTTYLIAVGRPTRFRGQRRWQNIWHSKFPPPRYLQPLHELLLDVAERNQIELPAVIGLSRNHGKREAKGFKGILIARLTPTSLEVLKSFGGVKGIPGAHSWADFEWKRPSEYGPIRVDVPYLECLDSGGLNVCSLEALDPPSDEPEYRIYSEPESALPRRGPYVTFET